MSASYTVTEVDSAIRNLADLLDVMCDIQFDLGPEGRDTRLDSLMWIARDLSDGIVAYQDQNSLARVKR